MRLNKKEITFKVLRVLMALSFLSGTIGLDLIGARPAYSEPLNLPAINQFVTLSDTYSFPVLKGLRFDPANPLTLEFIVDTADQKDVSQEEASSLIKYFLAALTIPEEEIWVNLSPYEQDRVIPENLGQTDLGKGLLGQDYVLKQLTSSLTYPESDTGKDYWERTYAEVLKIAKTTNLPVSTFNKIWIVPDKAQVYENENIAVISEASLKAMLEEDYLALQNKAADIRKEKKNLDNETIEKINKAASDVMKEAILPQINRDINSGKNFAALRQIYHSLILGIWFKKKFQDSLYAHYINKGMIKGIDLEDKAVKDKIYNHYVEAFKAGLYNYVKTDYDPGLKKNLKRRYYSGGFSLLGDGFGGSLSWFRPEEKSPSYIASMLRIGAGGPAQSLVVKLEGSNGSEVVNEQRETIASAASPIGTESEGEERSFENAVKQKREIVIVENWGMDALSEESARLLIKNIVRDITITPHFNNLDSQDMDIIVPVAPSYLHMRAVADELSSSTIPKGLVRLAAQDVSAYEKGRTGEVSAVQLKELGVEYVIVDARNERAKDKMRIAIKYSIKPIVVVGETERQYEDYDIPSQVVFRQLSDSIARFSPQRIKDMVIVYQPPESITPALAENVQEYIRMLVFQWHGYEAASKIRILYGGGKGYEMGRVDVMPNIDGVLINDAAWMSKGFSVSRIGENFLSSKRLKVEKPGSAAASPLAGGGAEAQAEKPASAASPVSAKKKDDGKTFRNAVKQGRKTVFVVNSSDSDIKTMEEFIGDLLRRIEEDPLLRNSAIRAAAIAAFPYSDNLQLLKEVSDRFKISGVSSELARLAVHYAPGIEKAEDVGEVFRKLKDSGVEYIIFDSRMQSANDKSLNSAVLHVIENSLKPIIVVGEKGEKDENPYATVVVADQLKAITKGVSAEIVNDMVIAYQPLGLKPFDAGQVVLTHIREIIFQLYGYEAASNIRILYGAENDISSVVNRKSDIDGVFSTRTSPMHGLYSGYIFTEFLRRRFEGSSSSPLADAGGGAEVQDKKSLVSAASPLRPDGLSGEDSSRRSGKISRKPIIATRLLGDKITDKITIEGAVQFINNMLDQLIGMGKLSLKEINLENLEFVVLTDLSLAHIQAMRYALKASGIPAGLVFLATKDIPENGIPHLEILKHLGVKYVVVNASEGAPRIRAEHVLRAGMKPIIVVGETDDEGRTGTALPTVLRQVKSSLLGISKDKLQDIVIAYQPPYKIRPDEAAWIQLSIRGLIRREVILRGFDPKIASAIRIMFSGTVNVTEVGFKNLLKADGLFTDNRRIVDIAEKFLEDREGRSSSPLAQGGDAEAQTNNIAPQANNVAPRWRKGGIDMQGIDVGADAGSSAPLFEPGFDLRNFSGFTFKIVAINEIDDFDSLVSQPRKQEKKLTSIGSPSV